jgi:hypothetical protein
MEPAKPQFAFAILAVLLLNSPNSSGFDTPLSDTAVRDAYFLGQRHDNSFAQFFEKYTLHLARPKSGPHIESIAFLTPFALAAYQTSQQVGIYSAQQAQLDHNKQPELVRVVAQIWLTDTYGQYILKPTDSRSGSPKGITFRAWDFWRDFRFRVFNNDQLVIPSSAKGEPTYFCGYKGGCTLTGATLTFEYPAAAFTKDSVTIQVDPPEGDPVLVDFDLTAFR